MTRNRVSTDRSGEHGIALVLVLLIVALLYIIVAEVVTRSNFDNMAAQNQAAEANIKQSLLLAFEKAIGELRDDSEGGGEEGAGGLGGAAAGGLGGMAGQGAGEGGAGAAGAEGAEGQEADVGDSSRDSWFRPKAIYDDNKITVYAFIEDENRKFNLLSLVSPDPDFRDLSRKRLVRLLDRIWEEHPDHDISKGLAETWARGVQDWMTGSERNDERPAPPLKTRRDDDETILPGSLEEFRLVPQIPQDVWEDRIVGEQFLYGLESVLTVSTSLGVDSGPPRPDAPAADPGQGNQNPGGNQPLPAAPGTDASQDPGADPQAMTALGPGIRVNINTAPRPVLMCLEDEAEMPVRVIEAILRHRNEVDEEAERAANEQRLESGEDELFDDEAQEKLKYFKEVGGLADVEEWENLPDGDGKARFQEMLTTSSHVFTVHLAAVYKKDEAGRAYTVTRARAVVVRVEDGEGLEVQTLIPLHRVDGLRLFLHDFPEEERERQDIAASEMGEFALEEQAWNPFFPDFYDPERRERR